MKDMVVSGEEYGKFRSEGKQNLYGLGLDHERLFCIPEVLP